MSAEASRRRRVRTPVLVVAALAWAVLAFVASAPSPGRSGMAGMTSDSHSESGIGFVTGWPVMLVAMMAPLLIPALRHAYDRSLPGRRRRTMALLVVGYLATWWLAGVLLQQLSTGLRSTLGARNALLVGLVLAITWQFSPVKQRCLNQHHAHPPLAAFGRAADRSAIRFGWAQATWCIGCCWSLMLLPLLAGRWQLAVMIPVSLWIWGETFDTPVRPTWRIRLPVRAIRIVAAASRP